MKRSILLLSVLTVATLCGAFRARAQEETPKAKVYFTSEISPESLVKIYQALGKEATGKVAVKISTGESAQSNQLRPELIGNLVKMVNGTLVECNTAYNGNRSNTVSHRRAIEQRGCGNKACLDLVFNHQSTTGDNSAPLIQRINSRHGAHSVEYAAEIGLGSLA